MLLKLGFAIDLNTDKMNRIYWIVLVIFALVTSSCSKEDGDVDDKLNGKTFEFERYYIRTDRSTSVHNWSIPCEYLENYEKDIDLNFSNYFDYVFPGISIPKECYLYNGVSEGERTLENNEVISDTIFSLNFSENISVLDFHSVKCTVAKGEELKCKLYTFLFKEGGYKIANTDYFVTVSKDKVEVFTKSYEVKYSLPLESYKFVIVGKSDYSKLLDKPVDASEQFTYKRAGEEIVFTNKEKELYGKIDLETMILQLEQISPTKEKIGEFKLK